MFTTRRTKRIASGATMMAASLFLITGCAVGAGGSPSGAGNSASTTNAGNARPSSENGTSNGGSGAASGNGPASESANAPGNGPASSVGNPNQTSLPVRGIIEGFYGPPWADQERIAMFQFMEKEDMNTYVYAPKNDPYQRLNWRQPYPAKQLAQMKRLVNAASQDKVQFVYSISPGMTGLSKTDVSDSVTYRSAADRNVLEAKIQQLESIGVHMFMLSFDDIETKLKPADQKVYGTDYAKAQMDLANRVFADERAKDGTFQLWLVPTTYYGVKDGPYWQTLRSTLNPSIQVIWTGKWVLNESISGSQAAAVTKLLGRQPILWDNYPVNDFTYTGTKQHQLLMGPLDGRGPSLLSHLAGYLSNPMLQPEASKLPLMTIADYLQHPQTYDPVTAWEQAIDDMPGVSNPKLFQTFAAYNSSSTLNSFGYAPTAVTLGDYRDAPSQSARQKAEKQLKAEFQTLVQLPSTLPPTITDKELLHEVQPWITELSQEGQGGLDALQVLDHPTSADEQVLAQQIRKLQDSSYKTSSRILAFMQDVAKGASAKG